MEKASPSPKELEILLSNQLFADLHEATRFQQGLHSSTAICEVCGFTSNYDRFGFTP